MSFFLLLSLVCEVWHFPNKAFEAAFIETVKNEALGIEKEYRGEVFFELPYKLRLNVYKPDSQFIISDGVKGYWVFKETGEVQESSVKELREALPLHFLTGKVDTLWDVRESFEELHSITFTPRVGNPLSDTLVVYLKEDLPQVLEIRRATGDHLIFRFLNLRAIKDLPDTLFTYRRKR